MRALKKQFATEESMQAFATQFAHVLTPGTCVYLIGDLGVGKTTFVRGVLRALGITGRVKSPTYTLVEPYEIDHKKIFHFDLYRVEHSNELLNIGIHEYFSPDTICLIEWPEKGAPLLPAADLICEFLFLQDGREVTVTPRTQRGEEMLNKLN